MNIMHAVILGIVQGATEVLPISSSAHLLLIPRFLGWPESGLTFDVALHFGTFLALFVYFRREAVQLVREGVSGFWQQDGKTLRLSWLLVLASVPAALVGKTLEQPIEDVFRSSPFWIVVLMIVFGLLLGLADRYGSQGHGVENVTLKMAMIIGCSQCLALLPGVSRSGITITAALLVGLSRVEAARFSFLMSLPIVFGAALLKGLHLLKHGIPAGEGLPMLAGVVVSAVVGYLCVAFLLRFVQGRTLWTFVWYRVALGGVVLVLLGTGILQ